MLCVFQAPTLTEAELYRQRLEEEGLPCCVRNVHLQGAMGELPANLFPEVCVLTDSDYDKARALIATMETQRKAPLGADRVCAACGEVSPGNFEICWKCRAQFDDR